MYGFPKVPSETVFALYKTGQVIPNTYAWQTIQFGLSTLAGWADATWRYDPLTYILYPEPGLLIGHLHIWYGTGNGSTYFSRIQRIQSSRHGGNDTYVTYTSLGQNNNYNHGVCCPFVIEVEPGDGFIVQLAQGYQTSTAEITWRGYSLNYRNIHEWTNIDVGSQYFLNYPSAKVYAP